MNLLITSVGRRSYMIEYFKSALDQDSSVHASNSEMTYALQVADKYVVSPKIYDDDYIEFLLDYSKRNSIDAIISLFDIDLPVLSKNKNLFEKENIKLIISSFEVVNICNDKWLTHIFLNRNGFKTPLTFLDILKCKEALINRTLMFPIIIKPRWGMGSIGIFEAENESELDIFYSKAMRSIERSYLKYESSVNLRESILFQEKLPGQEYGIDIFNDLDGQYICDVPKRKVAMRAGETDIADVMHDAELDKVAVKMSETLKHIGNLDVDCFKSGEEICILELNCRFGGQYPFSHLAGVNFPKMIIDILMKRGIDPKDTQYKDIRGFKDMRLSYLA